MSGTEIAAEVAEAIAEAGAETGGGSPLSGTITRTSGADETTYPPTPGAETDYACTVVLTNYSARDRDGTQITARDIKALIAPDAETDPRNGDRLTVAGQTLHLVNVDAVNPGGVVLMWKCQARAADG
ncbi:hypothetical protein [Mameliella alba]|uniref:hypothetical protein n=1 Tax=Mameliella alba TaxID=561184 RepID=UPI000B52A1B8|nr:hypothetical protein [Mameliella alba]OWV44210.1 hypothetical protein CDZ95_05860 [Mameliella alba]BBU58513.1 hypothetical protein KU6B_47780 [Mameliella alba]